VIYISAKYGHSPHQPWWWRQRISVKHWFFTQHWHAESLETISIHRLSIFENKVLRSTYSPSLIRQWLYSPLLGPGLFFNFVIFFTQTVGFLWLVISPSQGLYLNMGQHKHRINAHIDIHALSGIRTQHPSVRASKDSSCISPRGHCDRLFHPRDRK
jgi:hypothetical protein